MSDFAPSGLPLIGLRFDPTDEELLAHYLWRKINGESFDFIEDMDVYSREPWMLPHKNNLAFKQNEWFYFVKRVRGSGRNGNGKRPKRTIDGDVNGGCWKAIDGDKTIVSNTGQILGFKKTLTFYTSQKKNGSGRAGVKTDWIMKEYRLHSDLFQDLVLCKIRHKVSAKNTNRPVTSSPMTLGHNFQNAADVLPSTGTDGSNVFGYAAGQIPLAEISCSSGMAGQSLYVSGVDASGLEFCGLGAGYGQMESQDMNVVGTHADQESNMLDDIFVSVSADGTISWS